VRLVQRAILADVRGTHRGVLLSEPESPGSVRLGVGTTSSTTALQSDSESELDSTRTLRLGIATASGRANSVLFGPESTRLQSGNRD
jgi:hypothetical protein